MQIPFEIVGVISNSDRAEHQVFVSDDSHQSGGLLIYEWWSGSPGPNARQAFDSWVLNVDQLHQFFIESGWDVQWLPNKAFKADGFAAA